MLTTPSFYAILLNFGSFAVIVAILLWRYIKHQSYLRLIGEAWIGMFTYATLNSLVFPQVFFKVFGVEHAYAMFPESIAVGATGVCGWILGIYLVVLIFVVRTVWMFIRFVLSKLPVGK